MHVGEEVEASKEGTDRQFHVTWMLLVIKGSERVSGGSDASGSGASASASVVAVVVAVVV